MPLRHPVSDTRRGGGFPLPPSDPHPDGRASCPFHIDLRDLGDAQLWQLMEDLWQEVAHGELNASPGANPWSTGGPQQEAGTLMWKTRRLPSMGEVIGTQ